MRVLITGISGRIGVMVAEQLAEAGHETIGIDRRPFPASLRNVDMYEVDIRKRAAEDVFRKTRPEAVIHMATVTHLLEQSEDRYRINLGGTRAVFEHCQAHGVAQAIFVGRHTYYGAAPDSPLYHTEDEPPMAVASFPELADLVASDLYATTALWRFPELVTSVLRMCYSLGPTGHGTLATFLRGPRVSLVLGFDPLFQFMHEQDMASAICLALTARIRGVYNVAGPPPMPLSLIVREAGRKVVPVPEFLLQAALGRFGLPRLPPGAISHIKYPIVVDSSAFRNKTGFRHEFDELRTLHEYRDAFPIAAGN